MEPLVVAAIVNASAGVFQKVLELAGRHDPGEAAKKVVARTYDTLAAAISTNSLRALIVLQEEGSSLLPKQVRQKAQVLATRQEPEGRRFEDELTYRLRFLCQLGLLQPVGGGAEFAITRLGAAFVEKARGDGRLYSSAFRQVSRA
jgi:hypothetical protein